MTEMGLTKIDEAHGLAVLEEVGMLHGLLESHNGRGNPAGQRVRLPERGLGPGPPDLEVSKTADSHAFLENRAGRVELSLREVGHAEGAVRTGDQTHAVHGLGVM